MPKEADEAGRDGLNVEPLGSFITQYQTLVQAGLTANPVAVALEVAQKRGRVKPTKTRNLLACLDQHQKAVLHFMCDFRVP